jgi:hypothetical protein
MFLSRNLKKFMKPPSAEVAATWHRRLTYTYVLTAWTALGMTIFTIRGKDPNFNFNPFANGEEDWHTSMARGMQLRNPSLMTISNRDGITRRKIDVMASTFKNDNVAEEEEE